MRYIAYSSSTSPGLLPKVAGVLITLAVFAGLIVFSSVFLAVFLLAAAIGAIVVWWKTRHVRRMMREMHGQMKQAREAFENGAAPGQPFGAEGPFANRGPFAGQGGSANQGGTGARYTHEEEHEGVIIEGEAVRIDEEGAGKR